MGFGAFNLLNQIANQQNQGINTPIADGPNPQEGANPSNHAAEGWFTSQGKRQTASQHAVINHKTDQFTPQQAPTQPQQAEDTPTEDTTTTNNPSIWGRLFGGH
jgi:hypothetical protein